MADLWLPLLLLVALCAAIGALLGWAAKRFAVEGDPLVEQINAVLPQTQ